MEYFSQWELYEENLEGGLLYWVPRRVCHVRLWKWSISLCGSFMRKTRRKGSFTGDPEGYAK
jgi:hypothetical protein